MEQASDGCSGEQEPLIELISAWRNGPHEAGSSGASSTTLEESAVSCGPNLPCLAVTLDASHRGQAKILRSSGAGREMVIKEGTHAFVALQHDTIDGKPVFRVTLMSFAFGNACGHPKLANEQSVLFAGEIEFDGQERITRWNNLSGTYQSPEELARQAGLPMDKFWAYRKTLDLEKECQELSTNEEEKVEEKEGKAGLEKLVVNGKVAWLIRTCVMPLITVTTS